VASFNFPETEKWEAPGAGCSGFFMRFFEKKLPRVSSARKASRRKGQTLVEYSLILVLLTVVMIGALSLLGKQVRTMFSQITSLLDTAQGSG
jgi:Flp pilus assembly pilin Flp